ncbi:MAG: lytic transglycosylase domain-containing protein [Longimicrobiales bacterium]
MTQDEADRVDRKAPRQRRRDEGASEADSPSVRKDGIGRREATALGIAAASAGVLAAGMSGDAQTGTQGEADLADASKAKDASEARANVWDLPVTRNDRVDFFIEFLMGKNREKTALWLERIGRYGPLIESELREAGLPQDLLYLSMIESGLDPNAYSSADAAGLWQFIEETGERYGLEVSRYVDERRDPVRSTRAAIKYLSELNEMFGGSWYLAMAGYNSGENRVERILNEQAGGQTGDEALFWQIMDYLPSETRDYVPVTLAMGHIVKDPAQYGFTDIDPMEPLRFDEVAVPGGTTFEEAASAAGVSVEDIASLNPHLVRGMTPPDRDYPIRVPDGQGERVASVLQAEATGGSRLAD